ncbi:RNA ligase [Rickettsia endosymbiont of Orchestes rusci]|uniref:RNA ligase n=1 Tax=Rickettsia endosymbiont of Orchestes rusci TaxID=3066250 RepID=UPI00313B81C7
MRKLILLRGAPGSGKSTFIKKQNLEGFALSPDTVRILMGGIVMSPEGRIIINSANDKKVWIEVERILNEKMFRGEFIVIDATFQLAQDFKMPIKSANKHRYEIYCIDFTSISIETALEQNLQRELYKQVPKNVITRAYERYKTNPIPEFIKVFPYADFEEVSLIDNLDVKVIDLNDYKKIHHIGDIQGCYEPIAKYFADGFKADEFYIFVGDFLDRGIQNGEVIRWLVDEVMERGNIVMIWGNHETHIHRYADGQDILSAEFENNTLPQLEKVNFTRDEANRLCNKLVDCFVYEYGGVKCLVNHAGIAAMPRHLILLPSHQFWKGTGVYKHLVDQTFSDNMINTEWLQVHGHRNTSSLPIKAADKSYNLEAGVEFGGNLRIMTIAKDNKVAEIEIRNNIFCKEASPKAFKATTENEEYKISKSTFEKLHKHNYINRKYLDSYPHITSYNFSRKALTKGIWDKVSLTARGLFIDNDLNIVVRSYDKFFNLGEKRETELYNLQKNLLFPLTLFVKENGFLGLLGYDIKNDRLFFSSKATPESDFTGWFKEILTTSLNESQMDYLHKTVKDRNLSLVFEVNDPVNDPHMIEYNQRHVVLLDAVVRSEKFKRLDFHEIEQIAISLGVSHKQKAMVFNKWDAFEEWYKNYVA